MNYYQRRTGIHPPKRMEAALVVGERVQIVNAPASYGYNGRRGRGDRRSQISVRVDEYPANFRCNVFYIEELEHEETS